jgi:hypothetical protein
MERPSLALLLPSGRVVDVPEGLAVAILAAEPEARRAHTKWKGKHGGGGRVILIDADIVGRIVARFSVTLETSVAD